MDTSRILSQEARTSNESVTPKLLAALLMPATELLEFIVGIKAKSFLWLLTEANCLQIISYLFVLVCYKPSFSYTKRQNCPV